MGKNESLNDSSIRLPEQDRYGFDPFARTLAKSIGGMAAPQGMVLAVTGSWGSGKSGVVNLVLHHLLLDREAGRLQVVRFTPWWFDGREALLRAFFEALHSALGDALHGKAKKAATKAIAALFQRFKPVKSFVAVGVDVAAGGNPVGTAAVAAADFAADRLGRQRPVEEEYDRLAEALAGQSRRFLVVIDDIDRLDADEAAMVFRLVKSIGRLPNLVYLIAYDRSVAVHHLGERFGEAAPSYLEKVVQVAYELPVPTRSLLVRAFLMEVGDFLQPPNVPGAGTRFGNMLHDCVAPWVGTPRAVILLANALRVAWPAVENDVDPADLMALEAIKLAYPEVHRAVQANPQVVCGLQRPSLVGTDRQGTAARYDALLLPSVPDERREAMRVALRRLFPALDSVWANLWHDPSTMREARRGRRACARQHFDTYFLLAPGQMAVTAAEVAELFAALNDRDRLQSLMLEALALRRTEDGGTRAALLLEELRLRAVDVPVEVVPEVVTSLSAIADRLDVPEDDQLAEWGNQLLLWGVLRELTDGRLDQEQRSALVLHLADSAEPHWLLWMAQSAWEENQPPAEGRPPRDKEPFVTLEAAIALRKKALGAIRQAARIDTLVSHRKLRRLMMAWAELAEDGGGQVRGWSGARLEEDRSVVLLARALTFMAGVIGLGGNGFLGDRVETKVPKVDRARLSQIIDVERLATRARDLVEDASASDREVLLHFLTGFSEAEPLSAAGA